VTFIVHASKGENVTTTIRLSIVVAIAKGKALAEEGWQVFITAPDGIHYHPPEFEKLLSFNPHSTCDLDLKHSCVAEA
jgi:hypothetical protein